MKFTLSLRNSQPIFFWLSNASIATLLLLLSFGLQGQTVNVEEASAIAESFFNNLSSQPATISNSFSESINDVQNTKGQNIALKSNSGEQLFHIFNFDGGGFVIVAADQRYEPIIGYSEDSYIDENQANENLWGFLQGHKIQMRLIKDERIVLTENEEKDLQKKWAEMASGTSVENSFKVNEIVSPLTTTVWGQEDYFNAACPEDDSAPATNDGHVYTGCVTVAMSQILKYHNHPPQGNGYKSYNDPPYGILTADYGNTFYNWAGMEDVLTTYNDDVAQLMYHTATSIFTEFSPSYTAGYTHRVDDALIYHFNYSNEAKFIIRSNYTGPPWMDIVRSELDLARPVLMTGYQGVGASHAWVVDGYSDDDYFHVNWGWEGLANGWFLDNGEVWESHPVDNDPNYPYDIVFYDNQFMVYQIYPETECVEFRTQDIYLQVATENTATIYTIQFAGAIEMEWRYRRLGSNEAWTTLPITTDQYLTLTGLLESTEYELQVRQICGNGTWSSFSESYVFATAGQPCVAVEASYIYTANITDTGLTLYTLQPFGPEHPLQFRYRPVGTSSWIETDILGTYYIFLTDLIPGTTYEIQVRHECGSGLWTDFSGSNTVTTTGDPDSGDDCPSPDIDDLAVSTYYAYLAATAEYDWVQTQFRWRASDGGAWVEGPPASRYYRRIKGMGIVYGQSVIMQVRLQCSDGEWSEYSGDYPFTSEDNY